MRFLFDPQPIGVYGGKVVVAGLTFFVMGSTESSLRGCNCV